MVERALMQQRVDCLLNLSSKCLIVSLLLTLCWILEILLFVLNVRLPTLHSWLIARPHLQSVMAGYVAVQILLIALCEVKFLEAGLDIDLIRKYGIAGSKHDLGLDLIHHRNRSIAIVFQSAPRLFFRSAVELIRFQQLDSVRGYLLLNALAVCSLPVIHNR